MQIDHVPVLNAAKENRQRLRSAAESLRTTLREIGDSITRLRSSQLTGVRDSVDSAGPKFENGARIAISGSDEAMRALDQLIQAIGAAPFADPRPH